MNENIQITFMDFLEKNFAGFLLVGIPLEVDNKPNTDMRVLCTSKGSPEHLDKLKEILERYIEEIKKNPPPSSNVKYPNITVNLTEAGGNLFSVVGIVRRALKENNVPEEEIDRFIRETGNGTYEQLLQTCTQWVNVI